ncbi:MAG: potassium channel family protein [Phycisphaeraceae bacterium]
MQTIFRHYLDWCRARRGLSYALLTVLLFLVTSLSQLGEATGLLLFMKLALTCVTGLALITVSNGAILAILALLLASINLISLWWPASTEFESIRLPVDLAGSLFFVLVVIGMIRFMVEDGHGVWARLSAAVAGYLVAIWFFAGLYGQVLSGNPMAWSPNHEAAAAGSSAAAVFFSVVTQTTVGYGDYVPISGGMRAIAMAQAMFGVLYLAVAIARLVGLPASERSIGREGD